MQTLEIALTSLLTRFLDRINPAGSSGPFHHPNRDIAAGMVHDNIMPYLRAEGSNLAIRGAYAIIDMGKRCLKRVMNWLFHNHDAQALPPQQQLPEPPLHLPAIVQEHVAEVGRTLRTNLVQAVNEDRATQGLAAIPVPIPAALTVAPPIDHHNHHEEHVHVEQHNTGALPM